MLQVQERRGIADRCTTSEGTQRGSFNYWD